MGNEIKLMSRSVVVESADGSRHHHHLAVVTLSPSSEKGFFRIVAIEPYSKEVPGVEYHDGEIRLRESGEGLVRLLGC